MDKNEAEHSGGDPREKFPAADVEEDDCGELYKDIFFSEEFLQWRRENDDQLAQRNHEQAPPENKTTVIPAMAVESRSKDEGPSSILANIPNLGNVGNVGNPSGGGNILFVGELQWWTTDAELDLELSKYGPVKDVHFFINADSGRSLGYCQVEFYDGAAAAACKEGMNGHIFNGRPCVVEHATPFDVKRMGDAQVERHQKQLRPETNVDRPPRMPPPKRGGRGFGRGNLGRGMGGNRVPIGPSMMRGRGGRADIRGLTGYGNQFGQFSGLMGQGFNPAFGGTMGSYGIPQVLPPFHPPLFRMGMPLNVNAGMWLDPNIGGWAGDHKYGGRAREREAEKDKGKERLYQDDRGGGWERDPRKGKDIARDDRGGGWDRDPRKGKDIARDRGDRDVGRDRGKDHEGAGEQGRRHGRERERHRHERDRNVDDQPRNKNREEDENVDRSTSRGKPRSSREEEQRSRSRRGADYDRSLDQDRDRRRDDRDRKADHKRK